MKRAAEGKRKTYIAVVSCSKPVSREAVKALDAMKDVPIKQRTPIRVLHRRSLLDRDRVIHVSEMNSQVDQHMTKPPTQSMRSEYVNDRHFLLYIEASAGAYIKEFVHGDLGRTQPNLCSILKTPCDILQLDVESIVGVDIH